MVHSVDEAVGRIMTTLDELKLTDNTLIIFTSDNGGLSTSKGLNGPTDNAPLRSGKGFPYEGGIRVPLIVRWPGVVEPGTTSHVPVTSVDYFPTVLAAAKLKPPAGRDIDGVSLLPLLSGGRAPQREAVFWHFPHYRGNVVPYSIIRAGNWKLIKRYEGRTFELFNLKDDLSERNDLSKALPDKVRQLDRMLGEWLNKTAAKMPKTNDDYAPKPKP